MGPLQKPIRRQYRFKTRARLPKRSVVSYAQTQSLLFAAADGPLHYTFDFLQQFVFTASSIPAQIARFPRLIHPASICSLRLSVRPVEQQSTACPKMTQKQG